MNRQSLNVCTLYLYPFSFFHYQRVLTKQNRQNSPCLPRKSFTTTPCTFAGVTYKTAKRREENVQFLLQHSDLQLAAWEFALFSNQYGLVLLLKGDNTECQRWNCIFFIVEGWNPCHADPMKVFFCNNKNVFNLTPPHFFLIRKIKLKLHRKKKKENPLCDISN